MYAPVLTLFGQILRSSESSVRLLTTIAEVRDSWMRIQLSRVFRKYVSPETPVEMLRKKTKVQEICGRFGKGFRPIQEVQAAFSSRPLPDEALCALLWEYKDRGKKGYDLTERIFTLFHSTFPYFTIYGPERAGKDIRLGSVYEDYPNPQRPVDFLIKNHDEVLAIGLAHYDSDRGGGQEDDRTGGYKNCADEILTYARARLMKTKVIFINDGPGLLLGSMWDDYAALEDRWPGKVRVLTLRMVPERITRDWLEAE